MAIVADRSGNNPTDVSLNTFNRVNAGTPNGVLTPQYVGEIVDDTTNHCLWKSVALTTNSWIALTSPF